MVGVLCVYRYLMRPKESDALELELQAEGLPDLGAGN